MATEKPSPSPAQPGRLGGVLPGWPHLTPRVGPCTIGVLPGEGIGPEVIATCIDILERVSELTGQAFDIRTGGKIGLPAKAECGTVLPASIIDFCDDVFAADGCILAGPGGGRFVYELRAHFDLFCKLTPLRPFPELADCGVLRPEARSGVDIVMVRENIAGLYFGAADQTRDAIGRTTVSHRFSYREDQVERILGVAVDLASMRRGRVSLVVKPGGIPEMSALWSGVLDRLSAGQGVQTEVLEIDNASFQLINNARHFDVVVSPNMFGDILADCGSLLLGSRGMSFSGNFGPRGIAVYQTGHGAAHDLCGQDRANPIGQIESLAMLLRESFGLADTASAIGQAIAATLAEGWRTADICGPGSRVIGTREMGARIAETLERFVPAAIPA